MAQEKEPHQNPYPESMHMEGEFGSAMTQESIHALEVQIPNIDRRLSLYPIAKLSELTYALLLAAKRRIVDHQPCLTNDMN